MDLYGQRNGACLSDEMLNMLTTFIHGHGRDDGSLLINTFETSTDLLYASTFNTFEFMS